MGFLHSRAFLQVFFSLVFVFNKKVLVHKDNIKNDIYLYYVNYNQAIHTLELTQSIKTQYFPSNFDKPTKVRLIAIQRATKRFLHYPNQTNFYCAF